MDSLNSQDKETNKGKKCKAKYAEDVGRQNSLGNSKLTLGELIAQMLDIGFERKVVMLFESFKDESSQVSKNHQEKCQEVMTFLQNKIKQVKQYINQEKGANLINSNKQEVIKDHYKQIFTDEKNLNMFVQALAPDPKNINEDFDLMIQGARKYEQIHTKIIENLRQKSIEKKNNIWIIENYLGIKLEENQWTRVIFQMKRILFTEIKVNEKAKNSEQEIKEQEQKQSKQLKKQQGQKNSNSQKKPPQSKQLNKQKKTQPIIQKMKEHFKKQKNQEFIKYLEKSALIRTLIQIMKLSIAGKFYNQIEFTDRFKSKINQFYQKSAVQINNKDKPNIDLYLIMDNNLKEKQFKNNFDFFIPLLRHWFVKVGVRLHVIGYNKKQKLECSLEQEIQKLNKKLEDQNIYFEEKMKKIQEEIEKKIQKKEQQQKKKLKDEFEEIQKNEEEQKKKLQYELEQIKKREQMKRQKKRQKNKKKRQNKKKKVDNEMEEETETKTEQKKQQIN